ncbi:MAG TPA: YdeI/OmpD-associated family protein [Acidimicrobiia bacterium]|nr:YdeI/OmpD-associated family protein [Acidimicrobiia bacterium]
MRWIDDAKKAETRARRVANTVESLRSGTRTR